MNTEKRFQLTLLITRVMLAIVVLGHGVQKLFGWFGGYGFEDTMGFFTQTIGLSSFVALLIIVCETLGMIALISGLFSRVLSIAVIAIMIGAITTMHGANGFFMNWSGTLSGEGYEFHLLVIAMSAVVAINGSGVYSLDHYLRKKYQAVVGRRSGALS